MAKAREPQDVGGCTVILMGQVYRGALIRSHSKRVKGGRIKVKFEMFVDENATTSADTTKELQAGVSSVLAALKDRGTRRIELD